MKRNLLLSPGPTQIPQDICEILGRPIIHHRTPQFQENLKEVGEGLKYVCQTKNDVYLLTSSGTGAMEAAVCNLLSSGDKAICVESGKFGERWTELCKAYGVNAQVIEVEWGTGVEPEQIKDALAKNPDTKVVFTTLVETSTGITTNIKAIAEVTRNSSAVLVVDAVSGLGVTDLQMDNWGVDVVVSGSHKGLTLPPGIAFIAVNDRASKLISESKSPKYYFDLRKYKKAWTDTDTPFTPAIGILIALTQSLKRIKAVGLENLFAHFAKLAKGTHAAVQAIGLSLYAKEPYRSNAITAINVPEGMVSGKITKIMRDTYGITITGGQGDIKDKIIRIAHMGCIDEYDILTGISCLEKVLNQLGHKFTIGAGLKAAQELFNK